MTGVTPGQAFRDALRERWIARGMCVDTRDYDALPQEDRDDLEAAVWAAIGVALPGIDAALTIATALRERITALAGQVTASARATEPSRKSQIEHELAIELRKLLEDQA